MGGLSSLLETGMRARLRWLGTPPDGNERLLWLTGAAVATVAAAVAAFVHPLAAVALAVAVVAAPLVLTNVVIAIIALIGVITLLPFGALPLGIGFNPTLLDFGLGALLLIWIGRLATRRSQLLPLPPGGLAVAALLAVMAIAFLFGLQQGIPEKNQIRAFGELILGAGLYFVLWGLVTDAARLRALILSLVTLGAASAMIGLGLYVLPDALEMRILSQLAILDYPSGFGVLRYLNDDPARLQRATGTSIDPNTFGGMLAVVTALLAAQVASRTPLLNRRLAWVALGLVGVALLATVSRGSLLGAAAGVGLVGAVRDRRLLGAAALALVALLGLAKLVPWTASYVDHFTAGLAGADLATQMRFGEYRDALRLIERYPLLGVGFGGVRDIDLYRGVSSLYLIIAETMGALGLAAFLVAVLSIAARLAGAWRSMAFGPYRSVVLGSLAALTAALVSGVFDHYFFTYPHAFALLWVLLAIGACASRLAGTNETINSGTGGTLQRKRLT
jgi:polysaccharide biosynthesis protein PslJ